jgi:hypothetical protein
MKQENNLEEIKSEGSAEDRQSAMIKDTDQETEEQTLKKIQEEQEKAKLEAQKSKELELLRMFPRIKDLDLIVCGATNSDPFSQVRRDYYGPVCQMIS